MKKSKLNMFFISFLIGFMVLSLTPDGTFSAAQAERDHIVVQTWGGKLGEAQEKAFFEPFTKETGIKVIGVEAGTSVGGKLAAMQRSKNIEWDIITADYESYNTK